MRVCGVDDAGRGPVIGPLVIAGVIIEEDKLDLLKMLGVRDSKQLLSSARTRLSKEIPGVVDDYHVLEIESQELDRIVNRAPKFQRLNLLEAKVMAQVIEKLKPDLVYVDSSDTRTERFKNNILDCLSFTPRIVSEHKADINYPVVSAAGIRALIRFKLNAQSVVVSPIGPFKLGSEIWRPVTALPSLVGLVVLVRGTKPISTSLYE